MISPHAALIYTMVLVSASDRNMTDAELRKMGEVITDLPVFRTYDRATLPHTAAACADILANDDGLEQALTLISEALPVKLRETAYALACDVAAADGRIALEEVRMLEMIRNSLDIEPLVAAAIERATRARFAHI